jgi:hypothetical protein
VADPGRLRTRTERTAVEVATKVQSLLDDVHHPYWSLNRATLHSALRRMEACGLIARKGSKVGSVPGPYGSSRTEIRPAFVRTEFDDMVLARYHELMSRSSVAAHIRSLHSISASVASSDQPE